MKKFTKIYPLSKAANPPAMNVRRRLRARRSTPSAPADYAFWEFLNQVVQEEPSDSLDPTRLGFFAAIGIQKGKPFTPDARMKKILTEAAAVGDATARAISFRIRETADFYYPNSAWRLPFLGGYKFEEQPGVFNLDGYVMFYFIATGVTPAMEEKMVGRRLAIRLGGGGCRRQPAGWRKKLSVASAAQYPGQRFLVGHPLQQPDSLDAADRSGIPERRQPDQGTSSQWRRVGRCLFRTDCPARQGEELDTDRPRQGLEHHPAPLWSA